MEIDLSEFEPIRKGPSCTVGAALAMLDGEQLEKAEAALAAPHIQHAMIARRLAEWTPVKVRQEAVARHRQKVCVCE